MRPLHEGPVAIALSLYRWMAARRGRGGRGRSPRPPVLEGQCWDEPTQGTQLYALKTRRKGFASGGVWISMEGDRSISPTLAPSVIPSKQPTKRRGKTALRLACLSCLVSLFRLSSLRLWLLSLGRLSATGASPIGRSRVSWPSAGSRPCRLTFRFAGLRWWATRCWCAVCLVAPLRLRCRCPVWCPVVRCGCRVASAAGGCGVGRVLSCLGLRPLFLHWRRERSLITNNLPPFADREAIRSFQLNICPIG